MDLFKKIRQRFMVREAKKAGATVIAVPTDAVPELFINMPQFVNNIMVGLVLANRSSKAPEFQTKLALFLSEQCGLFLAEFTEEQRKKVFLEIHGTEELWRGYRARHELVRQLV